MSFVAIVIIATGAATTAATAASQTSAASPAGYHIQSPIAGKCITVKGGIGAWLYQDTCRAGDKTQEWTTYPVVPGYILFQNVGSRLCMQDGPGTNIHIIQEECAPTESAQGYYAIFSGRTVPFSYDILENARDRLCVSVSGGSSANLASIVKNICAPSANYDQFRFYF